MTQFSSINVASGTSHAGVLKRAATYSNTHSDDSDGLGPSAGALADM
jgi:hypothetical protein